MALDDQEPYLRMAISNIENSVSYADRLGPTEYDRALERFFHHANEAANQLRLWAQANDIEIREGMKT